MKTNNQKSAPTILEMQTMFRSKHERPMGTGSQDPWNCAIVIDGTGARRGRGSGSRTYRSDAPIRPIYVSDMLRSQPQAVLEIQALRV